MEVKSAREEEFARKLTAFMEQSGITPGELDSKWGEFLNEEYGKEALLRERLKITGFGDDDPALRAFPEVTLESLSSYMTDVLADCRLFNFCYDELASPHTRFSAKDLIWQMGLGEPCFLSRLARDCFRASVQLYEIVRFTQEAFGEEARIAVEPLGQCGEVPPITALGSVLLQMAWRTRQTGEDLIRGFDAFLGRSSQKFEQNDLASLERILLDLLALQALAVESGPFWSRASYEVAEPFEVSVRDGKLQCCRGGGVPRKGMD